ncbi:MAG: RNA polymerase factor sigma-54 [Pseudomonadales bacterium]|nr:RNA polymerase factor sigma-54 [Pseudomonadales bacterium]
MKISLQLKLGQQLTMTPQLQQAIRLLQLSTLDLQQEINQALESNPMLEVEESGDDFKADNTQADYNGEADTADLPRQTAESSQDTLDTRSQHEQEAEFEQIRSNDGTQWEETIPKELATDSQWEDVYQNSHDDFQMVGSHTTSTNWTGDEDFDFESRNSPEETLQDHLMWQLNLTPMSDTDRIIGLALIDAIDSNGMLTSTLESIHAGLMRQLDIDLEEVLAVLHRIQQFDPVGVGYRDLAECLLIQLQQFTGKLNSAAISNARLIVSNHLKLLANRDYAQLMRLTRLKEPELQSAISVIESLNPRPGSDISPASTHYVIPDVFVSKDTRSGDWKVELNPESTPRIRINPDYASLVKRADNSNDNTYLRDNLQEARWFLKSLQSRNETLMKVATRIVEHQRDFLEHGPEAMKPLVLHDIAQAVDMHESTISRVTTQKYMHTPKGIFELKYFFSSHVSTTNGGECSSTAIRALIKKLIAGESTRKPLSDSKITKLLEEQGITVARRTIAKYRESLSIPPSNERKRLV